MSNGIAEPLEVYIVCVKWTGRMVHLLWHYGEPDGVIVDSDKRVVTYESKEEVHNFAVGSGMVVSDQDSVIYDFDSLRKWTHNPLAADIIAPTFLDCWNMLDDICTSVGRPINVGVV